MARYDDFLDWGEQTAYDNGYDDGFADGREECGRCIHSSGKHDDEVRMKVVKEILNAIINKYDLDYGEILIDPRDFYDLVEGFLVAYDWLQEVEE